MRAFLCCVALVQLLAGGARMPGSDGTKKEFVPLCCCTLILFWFRAAAEANECLEDSDLCGHFCEKVPGGHKCFCDKGYKLNEEDKCEPLCPKVDQKPSKILTHVYSFWNLLRQIFAPWNYLN